MKRLPFPLYRLLVCLPGLGLCLASGCGGGSTAKIHGKVTLDGQPVKLGAINFVPADGKGSTAGGPIADGAYTAQVPFGSVRVEIHAPVAAAPAAPNPGGGPRHETFQESIPPQFNTNSKLVREIDANSSEVDFELKSKE